jgi:hypothetical protein
VQAIRVEDCVQMEVRCRNNVGRKAIRGRVRGRIGKFGYTRLVGRVGRESLYTRFGDEGKGNVTASLGL